MNGIGTLRVLIAALLLGGSLLAGLSSCGNAAAPEQGVTPGKGVTPVIVDTDMNADDIMALAYLVERRDIFVQAVTVEGDGVAHGLAGARNAQRLLRALRITRPVPVAYGPPYPLAGARSFPPSWRAAADQMFGLGLPASAAPAPAQDAPRLIMDALRRSARPVTLVTLGPFTDLALALRADPGIARKIAMVYSMAGAVRVAGNEPSHRRAEWNVYIDPEAAARVLRSGVPMTFIPLDASDNVPVTSFVRDAARSARQTAAMRIMTALLGDPYFTLNPVYFWDPLAAVTAIDNSVVTLRTVRLTIGQASGAGLGVTRISATGSPVRAATSADARAFEQRFLVTLDGGRPVRLPTVPASRRLQISFNGTRFGYHGPAMAAAGPISVRLVNQSPVPYDGFDLAIGRLGPGRGLADVQAAIRRHVTAVPAWFTEVSLLPGPPGADPAWAVTLSPGRYAFVCVIERTGTLHALAGLLVKAG